MKIKALSPILGLSILGTGLWLFPMTGKAEAATVGTELKSSTSLQLAQAPSEEPAPPEQSDDSIPALPTSDEVLPGTFFPEEGSPADADSETPIEGAEDTGTTEDGAAEDETGGVMTEETPDDGTGVTADDPVQEGSEVSPATEQPAPLPDSPFPTQSQPGTFPPQAEPDPNQPVIPPSNLPTSAPPSDTANPEEAKAPEPQVLVSEVVVEGASGDLVEKVYEAISTRPGQAATRSQIQADINAIYATGYFNNVQAAPSDTPLGVRVTYVVRPNPVLRSVQLAGSQVVTDEKVDEIFGKQYGQVLNLNDLQTGVESLNKYYQDSGYVLGQVIGAPQVDSDGTVTLQVAEGEIEDIGIRFQNDEGEPVKGKTKEYIITREMRTKPGDILNRDKLQADLQRIFGLNLFEDVQVALEPGQDPRKVVVNLNVQQRKTGSFSAGAGFSSTSGFFGTGSYSQSNFLGRNYRINAQAQVGTRELLFDASFTDPWIKGDPYHTSYTVNVFNRLSLPLVFDGGVFTDTVPRTPAEIDALVPPVGDDNPVFNPKNPDCRTVASGPCDVRLPVDPEKQRDNPDQFIRGDTPRINRLGGGVSFTRPLSKNPDKWANAWIASAGIRYERVSSRDSDFDLAPVDELGNPLTFSGVKQQKENPAADITKAQDDLFSVQFGIARDLRNDPLTPTKGNVIRIGAEQTLPFGSGSIAFTRLRASYSHFLPVRLLKKEGPQALAFNVQGGTIIGDLPPYEAFNLGGSNSVRGYDDGDVGSGRSFLQATAEYRFPLINFLGGIGGVLFVDYGSVLGTDNDVPGNPSIIRGKPGDGFGFGAGVRVKTPIGPVRIDYAINDDGENQVHFGFGERF